MSCLMYRTAQALGATGGGGPAGDGSIWIEPDFAALDALTGVDDGDIGVTENNGWIYFRLGGVWEFFIGNVDERANLPDPANPTRLGAVCSVGTVDPEDLVYFVYDGAAWERSPDLTGYIWPDVATFANLPTTAMGLESGDRCTTTDTGFVWSYNGADWEQVYGTVATVANLPSADVAGSALFGVGSNGVHERTWYGRHTGNWVRTPEAVPYGRTLSSITDVLTTDNVGDFGILTISGTPILLRLSSDVAAVGGATVRAWVRAEAYAATRTLQGWYTGSEADAAAVYAQGCIRGVGNNGTASITSGYLRLAATGAQTETVGFLLNAVAPGTRVYLRFEVRATASTGYNLYVIVADGANAVYLSQNNVAGGTAGVFSFVNGSAASIGTAAQFRGSRTALPTSTPDLFELLDDGGLVTVFRNGLVYASYQRTALLAGVDRIYWGFSGTSGSTAGNLETRNCVGYTWT